MALAKGTYRIHSCYNKTGKCKNVLYPDRGKTANGTRVYTQKLDGSPEQTWNYAHNRLYIGTQDNSGREKKCLDRLDTSANYADIYDNNDPVNQLLTMEPVSEKKQVYRIKLTNKKLYLTANTVSGTSSCTWQPLERNSKKQEWVFEPLTQA